MNTSQLPLPDKDAHLAAEPQGPAAVLLPDDLDDLDDLGTDLVRVPSQPLPAAHLLAQPRVSALEPEPHVVLGAGPRELEPQRGRPGLLEPRGPHTGLDLVGRHPGRLRVVRQEPLVPALALAVGFGGQ
ncbi:hypothetical protein PG988_002540 [Apiospora saccharicola]